MLKLEYDKQEILEVIDKIVKRTMKMDLTWDWPCGVAYFGIADAYEKTGNEEYLKLLRDRVDELIDLGLPKVWTVNACAMGHCLITLYKATEEQKYWDIVMSKINYIRKDALRFGDHVLQHTVSADNDFPEQCWADTLFMAAFFLLRVGVELADEEMIEDALNQYYWHIKYLQDPDTGLYYHGYNNITKDHMSGFYWGRANAWAAFTMAQVSDILKKCYLYPKYMDVAGSLNEQLSAIKLLQTEDGLWRTILNDESSYEEISASAGIAAAMVTRANPLHSKYINKSIRGMLANVGPDG
ncbi:MAG: glycoside hydrolase family 88 protein, partial [Lachnospiraceae bacterium]|nr:glycoside hydrolase family 88 protein [Lachnospiraceae bacterium]